ncbi:nuclear receptor subfamily 5, group A, member 5 [Boleophthalmus pectinirostris]|uniref:nuclear receptor subfamily 5, group A, member 5 n=1 Tax=Boleophthalmus pectinirostris TaxID=150288 RepID=UPI000A1C4BD0|nr:nuclear receptor subfamily 5, group A, member 5 [Boleophthalmus pectinirostris]
MDPPCFPSLHSAPWAGPSVAHMKEGVQAEAAPTSPELNTENDTRPESQESCPVCGDKVSGYHYGLLTCESCKGFFKRSVQNNKHYTCTEQQNCPMNLTQRKRCPYCRFQKCLAVGMKKEAVRADRMRGGRNRFGPLYRRDRQIKQQRSYQQTNAAPYRIKVESTIPHQSVTPNDLYPADWSLNTALSSATFQHSHMYHTDISHPELSTHWDCSVNPDRGITSPSLPYTERLPQTLAGYPLEKSHMSFDYHTASTSHTLDKMTSQSYTSRNAQMASSNVNTDPILDHTSPPSQGPSSSSLPSNFLDSLLESEQDEDQLCAKVLSSLQREQANRGKHDCLNTFSIMCKMADQTLFGLVEWARNSALFKELKVEDQMQLLQNCWSELLVLDHLCRQVTYGKEGCIYLVTRQQIEVSTIISQAGVTLSSLVSRAQDLVTKLKELKFDRKEFVCLKYLVLFNPDVKSVVNRRQVEQTQERINRALMEHTQQSHPGHSDKFGQLLLRLPEVRSISLQVEEYLYQRHLLGDLPCNSLLTEMLHTKHS